MRRSFRIGLLLFAFLATAGLGYLALQDEQRLTRARHDAAALDRAGEGAAAALADLRGTLHAYVAPGQGVAFWSAQSAPLLDTLRVRIMALDEAVAASGGSLAEALDSVDQLAAAETRIRSYAARGEALLAGDVLFTEVRDLLASTAAQAAAARVAIATATSRDIEALRREQAALAAATVAIWMVVALVFLPGAPRRRGLADEQPAAEADAAPAASIAAPAAAEAPQPARAAEAPALSPGRLRSVGEVCADLSALSDIGALTGALARAADALEASGVIVWVASNDGNTLSPVAMHGFDTRLLARIGTVARDSSNLTALAFRENTPQVSAATATSAAAVAVSLCGPTGPVGVLSAELRPGHAAGEVTVSLATIFAAQLATLAAPMPATATAAPIDEDAPRTAAL